MCIIFKYHLDHNLIYDEEFENRPDKLIHCICMVCNCKIYIQCIFGNLKYNINIDGVWQELKLTCKEMIIKNIIE